jgi:hypothetical protein
VGRFVAAAVVVAGGSVLTSVAGTAHAAGGIVISEVTPWASGNSTYAADWFEVTNTSGAAIGVAGWKVDDGSNSFAASLALNGVSSIGAGESVIFIEGTATTAAAFETAWFGATPPPGLQVGTYSGSGIGLSTDGDAVNLYDGAGVLQARVTFGTADASAPFSTFDNAAGIDNGAISQLSAAGVNGAFTSPDGNAIGSPGSATVSPPSSTTTTTIAPTTTVPTGTPWPGGAGLTVVDDAGLVTTNLSGLTYHGTGSATPGVLWAVQNDPGTLFKLVFDGANWVPAAGDWAAGKALKYTDGGGNPDAESVTLGGPESAGQVFVSTERNNTASSTSLNAILRFDTGAAGTTSVATGMWNLTTDLPANSANTGLEAITFIPDSYLVANGFVDDSTGATYDPSVYANHGSGLFFVGVEFTGNVYAYALDLGGTTFHRVATFTSGFPKVMASEFDADTGDLWTHCDNACQDQSAVLRISGGHFAVVATYERPGDMPATANIEGLAIAPTSECTAGVRPVYWADDDDSGGFSLSRGSLNCTSTPPAEVPEFPSALLASGMGIALLGGVVVLTRRRRPRII